jgi:hypothetical protein
MKVRLMATEADRSAFRVGMTEARASRPSGFRETERSRVSEIQLNFARLYGAFDAGRIVGGFSLHRLDEFGQSFPRPDLHYAAADKVFEAGQLWANGVHAAWELRHASYLLMDQLEAEALLIYPLINPRNISMLYRAYRKVGEPFENVFARTLDGGRVMVQAMILDGDRLFQQVERARNEETLLAVSGQGDLTKVVGGQP